MISLLYEPLPESILADGEALRILTDFRAWVQFIEMLGDKALEPAEKAAALSGWLEEPRPVTREIVEGLKAFCLARQLEPDPPEDAPEEDEIADRPPSWDWCVDAKFVIGDFRRYYGIDLLRVGYLHWWEFRALFAALPENSRSLQRIGIRSLDLSQIKDKDTKRRYAEMQRRIALPFEMDDGAIGAVFAAML